MRICCFILLYLSGIISIYSQDSYDDLKLKWQSKQFSNDLIISLLTYRKNHPDLKSPELDYMIATSYCALNNPRGCETWFPLVLQYSNLDARTRNFVNRVKNDNCPIVEDSNYGELSEFNGEIRYASVSGRPKQFTNIEERPSIVSRPVRQIFNITDDIISNRLFPQGSSNINRQSLTKIYPGLTSFYQSEDFILVNYGRHTADMSMRILNDLENTLQFFLKEFDCSKPDCLITIHIVPPELTEKVSESVYGIRLPVGAIGYSLTDDLSIFGAIRDYSTATGTLKHELFHIVIKNEYKDIPIWLEEGLASLYEESVFVNGSLVGKPGWRGGILKEYWPYRPEIKEILNMYPDTFDGFATPDNINVEFFETIDIVKQAANHAMARYLMLYLQDKPGKLTEIYSACRNIDWENIGISPGDEYVRIFENTLNETIDQTDTDFIKWFKKLK